jgi:hypothetical protein
MEFGVPNIDLFSVDIPEERLHPHFKKIRSDYFASVRKVLAQWVEGFIDRDNKFKIEFQTTFNSSFWELYLHAAFREIGLVADFSHERPDFIFDEFVAEAVTSNPPNYGLPESAPIDHLQISDNLSAMVRLSTLQLSGAIRSKMLKYQSEYRYLPQVGNKPFVVCIAPFDQPSAHSVGSRPILRCLYGFDGMNSQEVDGVTVYNGFSEAAGDFKANGSHVDLGIFKNDSFADVSAVIFSNVATIGKARALAEDDGSMRYFLYERYDPNSDKPKCKMQKRSEYRETILDGLTVFLNPFARIKFNPRIFINREIAIWESSDLAYEPEDFLLNRIIHSIDTFKEGEQPEPVNPMPFPQAPRWPEGQAVFMGGNVAHFVDTHLMHYKGFTVSITRCLVDNDWQYLVKKGSYYSLREYTESTVEIELIKTNFATVEIAAEEARMYIDSQVQTSA